MSVEAIHSYVAVEESEILKWLARFPLQNECLLCVSLEIWIALRESIENESIGDHVLSIPDEQSQKLEIVLDK